jgi:putative nucleotidyltransferase with HDIG domain
MLKGKVDALYGECREGREAWADWLYEHHVFLVADKAAEIAQRFGADPELAAAAGMLHDIADAEMSRFAPGHAERSLAIARELLAECGYTVEEILIVVDDAIMFHGCRDGVCPQTMEGKSMAAADAVVHLTTDFYEHAHQAHIAAGMSDADSRAWTLKKLDRDSNDKILFPEVRAEMVEQHDHLRRVFSQVGSIQ